MNLLGVTISRSIHGAGIGYLMQTFQLMNVNWKLGAIIGGVASLVENIALSILTKNHFLILKLNPWTTLSGAGAAWYTLKFKFNIITSNLSSILGPISNPNLFFAEVFLINSLSKATEEALSFLLIKREFGIS